MSVKTALSTYPGTISLVPQDLNYPGCKAKFFWSVGSYNRFFTEKPGSPGHAYVVVGAAPISYFLGLLLGVMVHYTKQLTAEEEADFEMVSREIEFGMQEKRRERAQARKDAHQLDLQAQAEVARLAAIGKKYEDRVAHKKSLAPSDEEYKDVEKVLNAGDPEILFLSKEEAFKAGFVHGRTEVTK